MNRWTRQFQTERDVDLAKEEWGLGLAGVSAKEIKRGLAACRTELDWPPSIAAFRRACKGGSAAACHRAFKALPKPKANPVLAGMAIEGMRAALRRLSRTNPWQQVHGMKIYV